MRMRKSFRYRIYPNATQQEILKTTLRLCRNLYNAGLEQRRTAYEIGRPVTYNSQSSELPILKAEIVEYREVYGQVLQGVLHNLDKTFNSFFSRVEQKKAGKNIKVGYPRYKSTNRFKSITYPQSGFKILPSGHLKVSRIGIIRMFYHRPIKGKIKTMILNQNNIGEWFAIFSVEQIETRKKMPKTAIGVDVGLRNLVTTSNGETIPSPKFLLKTEDRIKRLQKKVDRKEIGSQNRKRAVRKLAKAHYKVSQQRDDFLHKTSKKLSTTADIIVFENLNIQDMRKNHKFSKLIIDASWRKLIQYTTYKAEEAGGCVKLVNPKGTSQICSQCGEMVKKSLSARTHTCLHCGFSADRDLNASLNILKRLGTGRVELYKMPVETLPLQRSFKNAANNVKEAGSLQIVRGGHHDPEWLGDRT